MSPRIASYLREAAKLLSTELAELRLFSLSVLKEVQDSDPAAREETLRKYSRELAGRFHRAHGAAGFLELSELSKFAKGIEDLFRSVQEQKSLEVDAFMKSLSDAADRLTEEVQLIDVDLRQ